MKQHITEEQFKELGPGARKRLKDWWESYKTEDAVIQPRIVIGPNAYPKLSIGQMIEFLYERKEITNFHALDGCYTEPGIVGWHVVTGGKDTYTIEQDELCDALWESVKIILEQ